MDSLFVGLHQRTPSISPTSWSRASFAGARAPAQLLPALDQNPPRAQHAANSKPQQQAWLTAALSDLRGLSEEAPDEGYPEPTPEALAIAESLLTRIAGLPARLPCPNVYPTADQEIDLYFRRGDIGASVLVVIDHDGGGACFSNVGGRHRTRHENITRMVETIEGELIRLSRLACAS